MLDHLYAAWTVVYTVVLAIFLFGLTVFVHEFGHFIVARRKGLEILAFSIGFGKALVQWERDGIAYKIGWIPFGGYVALPQLDPAGMERIQGGESRRLPPVSPWKKIAVAVAGPSGNIVLAILLALTIWLVPGDEAGSTIRSVLGTVETNSAAFSVGLRAGDEITAVNGTPVDNWYDFSVETHLQKGETVDLTVLSGGGTEKERTLPVVEQESGERLIEGISPAVPCIFGLVYSDSPADKAGLLTGDEALAFNGDPIVSWDDFTERVQAMDPGATARLRIARDGAELELTIAPEYNEEYGRMMIGVQLGGGSGMPWMHYKNPIEQIKHDALAIVRVLEALTNPEEAPQAAKGLGGPLAILDMLMISIKMGILNTLGLIRFLNINLAIINLLPIPVLDGGHIAFSLWEGITRRKVHAQTQAVLVNLCAILLIGAMLLLTFNDIDRKLHIKRFVGGLFSGETTGPAEEK